MKYWNPISAIVLISIAQNSSGKIPSFNFKYISWVFILPNATADGASQSNWRVYLNF